MKPLLFSKRNRFFLAAAALCLAAAFLFTACGTGAERLPRPMGLRVSGTSLVWNAVPNAVKYTVRVNSGAAHDNGASTSYSIALLPAGRYTFLVQAIGDGEGYADSRRARLVYTKTEEPSDADADTAAVESAKQAVLAALDGLSYPQAEYSTGNETLDKLMIGAAVIATLSGIEDGHGVTLVMSNQEFTPAVAGTAQSPSGTDGAFTFDLRIEKGAGEPQTLDGLTVAITATAYEAP